MKTTGGVKPEPDAGLPSHGKATKIDAAEMERVKEMENVVGEEFDRVWTGCG